MKEVRQWNDIKERIREVEDRLETIEAAISKEKQRDFPDRRYPVCHFLHAEKKVYSALLKELKWTIHE